MKKAAFIIATLLLIGFSVYCQKIDILTEKSKISLPGLSVVNDTVCWASGSKGTIVRTTNGGKNFEWMTVKGYEQRDFRDIEAFDLNTALIMAVAEPAVILKTKDGGKNWYKVFEDSTKGMFLDAMSFDKQGQGFAIGDPLTNKPFMIECEPSSDIGNFWESSNEYDDTLAKGEAFFASSGTNVKKGYIAHHGVHTIFCFVSGGAKSHFFGRDGKILLPINQGKESTGANSLDINNENIVVVGGDFMNDKDTAGNCTLSNDFGRTWYKPQTPPHGYRSCVIYVNEKTLITCGTSGVDISKDGGMNWQLISNESFHVLQKAKQGNAIFMAGTNGRIASIKIQ